MSAQVPYKHWRPSENRTDGTATQTIGSAAAELTRPTGANVLRVTFEKDQTNSNGGSTPIARFYNHGSSPTATQGTPVYDGETRTFFNEELNDLEFIRAEAFDVKAHCEWFKA